MSEKRGVEWGERFAQLIGVACVAAVMLSIWPGWSWIACQFMKDGTPAWVQAIGSMLAIYVAIRISARQFASERVLAERLCFKRLKAFSSMVEGQVNQFITCDNLYLLEVKMTRAVLDEALQDARAMPIENINPGAVDSFIDMKSLLVQMIEIFHFVEEINSEQDFDEKSLLLAEDDFKEKLGVMRDDFVKRRKVIF